jgi:hypothetical protein
VKKEGVMKKFLIQFAVVQVVLFVGAALFVLSSNSTFQRVNYSNALFFASALMMGVGSLTWMGGGRYHSDLTARYIETVSHENLEKRSLRLAADRFESMALGTRMFFFGLLPLITAIVIGSQW